VRNYAKAAAPSAKHWRVMQTSIDND